MGGGGAEPSRLSTFRYLTFAGLRVDLAIVTSRLGALTV